MTAMRAASAPHDVQVVTDEDHGQTELVTQVEQQIEDLGLDRDVQGADCLISDEDLRLCGERAGDADTLSLAAGELLGVARRLRAPADRPGRAAAAMRASTSPPGHDAVDGQDLTDGAADRETWVERRERVLEHDLDAASAGRAAAIRPSP